MSKVFSLVIAPSAITALSISNATINDGVTGSLTNIALFTAGGAPPYTWSIESGNLPPGISLVSSGADYGSALGPGVYYLLGRVMQPGVYTFTAKVTDANNAVATRTFTWNVSRLAYQSTVLPTAATSTLVYNQPYTQKLLALGGTGTYSNWTNTAGDAAWPRAELDDGRRQRHADEHGQLRHADSRHRHRRQLIHRKHQLQHRRTDGDDPEFRASPPLC